eukprot:CAMPEP_0167795912 /NCGR_PEP_ID=MMETSP0111_2-20121227/14731_1 /TAXON_ID=91324 /ORGANISM="Lotharella globosa, Strain CCCM811" /LENGTH=695 /DNA_ID=CAMNT_0007689697 /DNA_START=327 /DNA_END=2414 /DNA_ORIENTATION=-
MSLSPTSSEIYRGGTPSPQIPGARCKLKLEMAQSADDYPDSFLSSAGSLDSARYPSRSAQSYSSYEGHGFERSNSFRLRNANMQGRAPVLEIGRMPSPTKESKSEKIQDASRFLSWGSKYHDVYKPSSHLDSKRRSYRDPFSKSALAKDHLQPISQLRQKNLVPPQHSKGRDGQDSFSVDALAKDFLQYISTPLRSKKPLPPRYGEARPRSQSPPLEPSLQQDILHQLLEQHVLNAARVKSSAHVESSGTHVESSGTTTTQVEEGNASIADPSAAGLAANGTAERGHAVTKAIMSSVRIKVVAEGKMSAGAKATVSGARLKVAAKEVMSAGSPERKDTVWRSLDQRCTGGGVEEFGTEKTAHVSLDDVAKRHLTIDLALDPYGSRFIQKKLGKAPASHIEAIFDQIFPHTVELCVNVFGNYVVQKLFEHGTMEHKKALASKLKGHVLSLSLHMYGCRVVQKAIDVLSHVQKAELVKELHGHVMKCVRNLHGNHVVQKCIERVPPSVFQFVLDDFKGQYMRLSMHPYACRVIQRLLEHCSTNQRAQILEEISGITQMLAKNQYGNYVVQHILIHANAEHRAAVMEAFHGSFVKLSKHKFASNVIEKCVSHATRAQRKSLIDEILGDPELDSASVPLMAMARDQYGNYVLQRLIEVADPEQKHYLIRRIQHHLPYLSKVPFGKHIIASIEKAQDPSL